MSDADLEVATEFLDTLATAAKTGKRDAVYPFLTDDVAWLTPQRELRGIDEVREQLTWLPPQEHLEVEFEAEKATDLGGGKVVSDVHETYRMKGTGDFAYARDLRVELTVREGKIAGYEMRIVG
jgi:ketosteroid isomerase-like protein